MSDFLIREKLETAFVTIMLLNRSDSWYTTVKNKEEVVRCGINTDDGVLDYIVSSEFKEVFDKFGIEMIDREIEFDFITFKELQKRFFSLAEKKDAEVTCVKEKFSDIIRERHEMYHSESEIFRRKKQEIISTFMDNLEEDTHVFRYHKHKYSEDFINKIYDYLVDEGFKFVLDNKPKYAEFIVSIYPIKGYMRINNYDA